MRLRALTILASILVVLVLAIVVLEIFGGDDAHAVAQALQGLLVLALPALVAAANPPRERNDDAEEVSDHHHGDARCAADTDPDGLRDHAQHEQGDTSREGGDRGV